MGRNVKGMLSISHRCDTHTLVVAGVVLGPAAHTHVCLQLWRRMGTVVAINGAIGALMCKFEGADVKLHAKRQFSRSNQQRSKQKSNFFVNLELTLWLMGWGGGRSHMTHSSCDGHVRRVMDLV